MGQLLLLLVVALTVAAVVFGVTVLVSGNDPGLAPVEPDGRAVPLPGDRPLAEHDVSQLRFDTALRGYRMGQVDQALRRAAYDIGYKGELIGVLEAEVTALREGRTADADVLRRAREAAVAPPSPEPAAAVAAVTGTDTTAQAPTAGQSSAGQSSAGQSSARQSS
ncbi:MAG TPA: DivIVA domain-containing protein, partial [Catenuloplanes sp.]